MTRRQRGFGAFLFVLLAVIVGTIIVNALAPKRCYCIDDAGRVFPFRARGCHTHHAPDCTADLAAARKGWWQQTPNG